MRVTAIKATNFHGRQISHELTPLSIIYGPEGSGKTMIPDAIRIALSTYDYRLGKRPSDTMEHAEGAAQMTITAAIDKRWTPALTWTRTPNGGASFSGQAAVATPQMLFDLAEFTKMTAENRSRYVLSLANFETLGFDEQSIIAAVEGIAGANDAERALIESLANEISLSIRDREEAASHPSEKPPMGTSEWLDGLVTSYEAKLKAAKQSLENATAARRGLAQGDDEQQEIPADVEVQLAKATEAKNTRWKERTQRETELVSVNRTLENMTNADNLVNSYTDNSREITAKREGVEAFEAEQKKLGYDRENAAILSKKASAASREVDTARADYDQTKEELAALPKKITPTYKCADPNCGHVTKLTKPEITKRTKALADQRKSLEKALATKKTRLDKALEVHTEIEAEVEAMEKAQIRHDELSKNINELNGAIFKLQTANEQVQQARATRAALGDRDAATAKRDQLMEAIKKDSADLTEIEANISRLSVQAQTLRDRRALESAKLKHEEDALKFQAEANVYKAAKEAIAKERDAFNEKVWGSLIETANKFTGGLSESLFGGNGGKLAFQDGKPGYINSRGHFISRTLSGTEGKVAFTGLSVALCQNAPIKIVIIDELGVMRPQTRAALVKRMAELIRDGVIDQFIGIDTQAEPYRELGLSPDVYKLIEVS